MAARTAASGNVPTQEETIEATTRLFALPDISPIPNRAPTLTWVVETGIPKREAIMTKNAVTRLAERPWPEFMVVTLWLKVSATLRADNQPPRAINRATSP
jgi:hypothetical protein